MPRETVRTPPPARQYRGRYPRAPVRAPPSPPGAAARRRPKSADAARGGRRGRQLSAARPRPPASR